MCDRWEHVKGFYENLLGRRVAMYYFTVLYDTLLLLLAIIIFHYFVYSMLPDIHIFPGFLSPVGQNKP